MRVGTVGMDYEEVRGMGNLPETDGVGFKLTPLSHGVTGSIPFRGKPNGGVQMSLSLYVQACLQGGLCQVRSYGGF